MLKAPPGSNNRPELPTELWLNIFKLAAPQPFALLETTLSRINPSYRAHEPLYNRHTWPTNLYLDHVETMKTTAGIVLVCKKWSLLAPEVLYEYVALSGYHEVKAFAEALGHQHNTLLGLAQHVRYLYIRPDVLQPLSDSHATAFKACGRLTLLNISATFQPSLNTLMAAVWNSSKSLRILSSNMGLFRPGFLQEVSDLNLFRNIEVLRISEPAFDGLWDSPICTFPQLHSLYIVIRSGAESTLLTWLSRCSFSASKMYLSFSGYEWFYDTARLFFDTHGSQFACVDLSELWSSDVAGKILSRCPQLEEINVSVAAFNGVPTSVLSSPRMSSINICTIMHLQNTSVELNNATHQIQQCFTRIFSNRRISLCSLRLSELSSEDFREISYWKDWHMELWREWCAKCELGGIRFEFSDGVTVSDAVRGRGFD